MKSCFKHLALLATVLGVAATSVADPILNTANGNYYELVTAPLGWNAAKTAAENRTFMGVSGHLLTINTQAEQGFLVETYGQSMREKYTGGFEVGMVWQWVTGEPFTYSNWAPGEPNGGGVINFHGANNLGTWNDVPTFEILGYFVEYETGFSLSLNKSTVAGQNYVLGTVKLGAVRATNTVITTYDNSSLVTTPPSATITAGTTTKNFNIQVMAVNSPIQTTIFAKLGTIVMTQPLTLAPLVPTAMVFTPNPVTAGADSTARLVINGVAGPGGRVVAIFDNSFFSNVPSTVIVPPGASQVLFTIETFPVPSQQLVTITARVSAGEKTGILRINPAP